MAKFQLFYSIQVNNSDPSIRHSSENIRTNDDDTSDNDKVEQLSINESQLLQATADLWISDHANSTLDIEFCSEKR